MSTSVLSATPPAVAGSPTLTEDLRSHVAHLLELVGHLRSALDRVAAGVGPPEPDRDRAEHHVHEFVDVCRRLQNDAQGLGTADTQLWGILGALQPPTGPMSQMCTALRDDPRKSDVRGDAAALRDFLAHVVTESARALAYRTHPSGVLRSVTDALSLLWVAMGVGLVMLPSLLDVDFGLLADWNEMLRVCSPPVASATASPGCS